jgi:hypothetical protein
MGNVGISMIFTHHPFSNGKKDGERGQSVVLFALLFVALASFIGLVTDVSSVYLQYAHLKRGVDAAALSAAAQYRKGTSANELELAAKEFLALNNIDPNRITVQVWTCQDVYDSDPDVDPVFIETCPEEGSTDRRKLIWVQATLDSQVFFLHLIGVQGVPITTSAIAEAAPLDIVLVIDTSNSMTFDAACGDGDDDDYDGTADDGCGELDLPGVLACGPEPYEGNDIDEDDDGVADDGCPGGDHPAIVPVQVGPERDDYYRDEGICNISPPLPGFPTGAQTACQPFEDVRFAAKEFVNLLFDPFDHVAVVSYAQTGSQVQPFQTVNSIAAALTALDTLKVSIDPAKTATCTYFVDGNPSGCTSTNIGGGLKIAGQEFNNARTDAIWVAILLTDGAANSSDDENAYCPTSTWIAPFCRDPDSSSRHSGGTSEYDTDDFARDMADFVGLLPPDGQGASVFTIGLGALTVCTGGTYAAGSPPSCDPPFTQGQEDAGEVLLRYIADIGDNATDDPCEDKSLGVSCGNYYFAPTSDELKQIFEDIADRILTRLTW